MGNVQGGRKKDTSYRKTFVLRQQTPMIHFQYADRGAVIRASEFKPKLDKFLVKKKGGENRMPGNWLLEQTDENKPAALNYKVRIWIAGKTEISQKTEYTKELNNWKELHHGTKNNLKDKKTDLRNKYPKSQINGMYFGNMGNDTTAFKKTIFYTENIYVEIQCFVTGLLDYISDNMAEFMLVTNFGTRQSKGFGSFALMDDTIDPCNILSDNHYEYIYGIVKDDKKGVNHEDKMLNVAAGIYAVMKGGINRSYNRETRQYDNDKYIKGYIQRKYLDDCKKKQTGSDKAFMKSKIVTVRNQRWKGEKHDNYESYSEFEYVRALLGITDHIVFRDKPRNRTVRIKNKDIERFGSAIQITVWGNYIFLIMKDEEYIKNILDKEFTFSYMDNSKKIIKDRIKTPAQFDAGSFLKGFVAYYNEERRKLSNLNFRDAANVELKMGGSGL